MSLYAGEHVTQPHVTQSKTNPSIKLALSQVSTRVRNVPVNFSPWFSLAKAKLSWDDKYLEDFTLSYLASERKILWINNADRKVLTGGRSYNQVSRSIMNDYCLCALIPSINFTQQNKQTSVVLCLLKLFMIILKTKNWSRFTPWNINQVEQKKNWTSLNILSLSFVLRINISNTRRTYGRWSIPRSGCLYLSPP